jgi:hypothetical protein
MQIIIVGTATDIVVLIALFSGVTIHTNKNIRPMNTNGNSNTRIAVFILFERM